MFQIDNSSTVAQMPSPSAAGTPGFFTDGNPATGQAATILPAEFMNMLMMELMSIVQAGNIMPDKTKTNQVLTALNALFTPQSAFANSKATSGYQKLQGGLIIQWTQVTIPTGSTSGSANGNWPVAFPTAILGAAATCDNVASGSWSGMTSQVTAQTLTGFTFVADASSHTISNTVHGMIIAIGY